MFHRVAPHQDVALRSSLHQAAGLVEATVVREAAERGALLLHLARGEHLVELSVLAPRVGPEVWTLSALRTGAAAELSVRPELPGEGLDKLLGITLDLPTGDAAFDRRFVVEAAPVAVAAHLLSAELRACLMRLDGATLRVTSDALSVTWRDRVPSDDLTRALRAVFDCLDRCRALHEAIESAVSHTPFRASGGADAAVDPRSRAEARARIGRTRRKAAAFIATTALAAAAFLASAVTVGR